MNEKKIARIPLEFGKRVKEIRLSKNITQLDLASQLGIDIRQLRRIENGEGNTSLTTIYLLTEALQVNIEDLFNFKL
ncbi:MAG: helix-turn-helix domain-containing protein [Cytophagaceae bacterium]